MIQKILHENYSNSGKTKYTMIYITDESEYSLTLSRNEESVNCPQFGRKTFKSDLIITDSEKDKFIFEKTKHFEEKANIAIQKEIEHKNKEVKFQTFLNTKFIDDIKYSEIYNDILKILCSKGDFIKFLYIEIVLVCLAHLNLIQIEWLYDEYGYNSYPKLINDILVQQPKIHDTINRHDTDTINRFIPDIYYILRDNKIIYKIECEDAIIDKSFCDIDYNDFIFKITKIL